MTHELFLPPSNFAVSDGRYFLQYCLLKIAQIAQVNQLFQLLNLVRMYGHSFYLLVVQSYANEEKCK